MRIRLACLDMAGTTVADDGLVHGCFEAAMRAVAPGRDMDADRAVVDATMGQEKIQVFRRLFDGDESAAQRANAAFEEAMSDAVARGAVTPIAGAADAIARIRALGVKLCLTTGFAPSTRDAVIAALGWEAFVDLALSPADAGRGRPWPDMIWTAAMRLGIDAAQEIAVAGDTVDDLRAGGRSGAGIVAGVLTGSATADALAEAPHTHILSSVAELPAVVEAWEA